MNINQIVDEVLQKDLRERKIGHYYVSEIPSCTRAIWYRYKKPKQISAETARIFERGNILHSWIARVLSRCPAIKMIEAEARLIIPIDIEHILGEPTLIFLRGRLDDFIVIEEPDAENIGTFRKYVLEIKTTANIGMQEGISPHHMMQITPYLMIEECKGKVVYIDAKYLAIKEFETGLNWDIWREIKQRTITLHKFLAQDKLPPPEARQRRREWECNNCAYANECWKNLV